MVELKINGEVTDLPKDSNVKYTLQVHDVADVSSVNASFTNSFKLDKTPINTRIMRGLGMVGDTSSIPYEKVRAELTEGGISLIHNGWTDIKNTNKEYNVSIIDGIIDFFKALENKKFGEDITLPELAHSKDVQTVADSYDNEFYRYLINDYGGRNEIGDGLGAYFTNIDYQVPSARVRYIWDRIFELLGFTYSGTIFENEDFNDAWVTFPKSNSVAIYDPIVSYEKNSIEANSWAYGLDGNDELTGWMGFNNFLWDVITPVLPNLIGLTTTQFRLPETNILTTESFRFTFSFSAETEYSIARNQMPILSWKVNAPLKLMIYRNGQYLTQFVADGSDFELNLALTEGEVISYRIAALTTQELWTYQIEQENDDFPFNAPVQFFHIKGLGDVSFDSLELEIDQVEFEDTSFEDAFKDMTPKDFVKDVMQRFALTPIPHKYENHITFYRLDEMLDKGNAIDWTDKYAGRTNESYTYDNYAQSNIFQHKYTQEAKTYANGILNVFNANLDESRTLVSSKYFAPEEELENFRVFDKTYKIRPTLIWTKEINVDEDDVITVEYKGNTGRYFWLKSRQVDNSIFYASPTLGETLQVGAYAKAETHNTTYADLVPEYYKDYQSILNNTRIHAIDLTLTVVDVINLDFTKPVYFAQEQSFYKLNKIVYESGKISKGEFIKLNYGE